MYQLDQRVVVTLDAGGTTLVFGAMKGYGFVVDPIMLPYPEPSDNLEKRLKDCMDQLVKGFTMIMNQLDDKPAAISFAFPGPGDYKRGIIGPGYLVNFPEFRNGVALGPFLEEKFGVPVFINNDGDLFAYGEALAGVLPEINRKLAEAGTPKRYKNLLGYTFGTGFGIGLVADGRMHTGDNSCVETFCLRHKKYPGIIAEDGISIRAVKRVYEEHTGEQYTPDNPKDVGREIAHIARGKREGNQQAACKAFAELGEVAGDAFSTAVTLFDGLIVIGGGLTGAKDLFMPALLEEMRSKMRTMDGQIIDRVLMKVYDLDDEEEFAQFVKGDPRSLKVYGTGKTVLCDPQKRIGVCVSKIGAARAISLGAYAYALNTIDQRE